MKKKHSSLERKRERKVRQLRCRHERMKHWKNGVRSSTILRNCKMHWALTKLCLEGWNSLDFVLKSYSYSPPRSQLLAESVFRRTENNFEQQLRAFRKRLQTDFKTYYWFQTGWNWIQTVFCSKLASRPSPDKFHVALPRWPCPRWALIENRLRRE